MTVLTRQQLYQYGYNAGFRNTALDEVVAIALAESGGDTQHQNINHAQLTVHGQTYPFSTDRGVLQINREWNPDVPDSCAFDPVCSFAWAYKVTQGRQPTAASDPFRPYWVTVQNSRYQQFITPGGYQSISGGSTSTSPSGTNTSSNSTDSAVAGGLIGGVIPVTTGVPATNIVSSITDMGTGIQNLTTSVAGAIGQVNQLQQEAPGAAIRIGLFFLLLIALGTGLFLIAGSLDSPAKEGGLSS